MDDKTLANSTGYFVTHLRYLETGCGTRGTSVAGRREEKTKTKQIKNWQVKLQED